MVDMMMVFDEMNANPINWVLLLAILYLCWVILAPMPAAVRWVMMNECVTVALSSSHQHVTCVRAVRGCGGSGVTSVCTRVRFIVRTSHDSRAKRGRSRMGFLLCPAASQASLQFCTSSQKLMDCVLSPTTSQLSQVLPAPAVKPPINP